MSKTLSIVALASALLFGAAPGHAAIFPNALFENGLDWNGLDWNGMSINGMGLNGMGLNGMGLNAHSQGGLAQLHIIAVELPKSH